MSGLTTAGLEIETLADVRDVLNADWRATFGVSMDVSDRSPDGHLLGIAAERWALFWELLEAIVSSQDPNKATGAALDAICALTGTRRRPASFSTVVLTLTGTPTTVVPIATLTSTASTGQQFTTVAAGTIAAGTAWAPSTLYTVGTRRINAGNAYICIAPGTSAASGGPTTQLADITDGTAHWRWIGEGGGFVDVTARATIAGPIVAVSGDITGKDTPVGGWLGVQNLLDAQLGRLVMTDPELRVLREQELARPGTSPKDAIKVALLDVGAGSLDPVTSVSVFQNIGDTTDVDGVPGHSIEALVRGGADQDIFDALLANVAAGIRTHGSVVGTSIDSEGNAQVVKFSRTVEILTYVAITLVKDPNAYPADGDAQVKAAVANGGNAAADGTDVVSSRIIARVFSVPGVLEVTLPLVSIAPTTTPVSSATIPISLRQRAIFDTTRVSVTSSDGVP